MSSMAVLGDSLVAKGPPASVPVDLPITLGQFVKAAGLAATGGEAKLVVAAGDVWVNGCVEQHRGHKLSPGDIVEVRGEARQVVAGRSPSHRS